MSPDENKATVWRAEASTEKIVERIQITVPRHSQPKHASKFRRRILKRNEPITINYVLFLKHYRQSQDLRVLQLQTELTLFLRVKEQADTHQK